ncbi:peroxiredoxin [bacterium]|nr:peroxiredoxin [bacterium]
MGQSFKTIKLDDYAGKWLVLFFYPMDFTFVCPTELIAFSKSADDFKKLNAELVSVSIDSKYTHLAWKNTPLSQGGVGDVEYPMLSDITKGISTDYGVLLDSGVALRGLFVIDPLQRIRHITINDLPIGRNVEEVKRVIKALQYYEEHGEVCPANWNPGDGTMVPDPEKSKEYFQSAQ